MNEEELKKSEKIAQFPLQTRKKQKEEKKGTETSDSEKSESIIKEQKL